MKRDPSVGHRPPARGRFYMHGPRPQRPLHLRIAFWAMFAIAGFYLLAEHRAHLVLGLTYLPFLLLAACPLLHVYGHAGHRGHTRRLPDSRGERVQPPDDSRGAAPDVTARRPDGAHRHGGEPP